LLCARTELEGPSVDVQKCYSSTIRARELWEIKYHVFESMRCVPGEHSEVALHSACTETFQCVILRRGKANINKIRQILQESLRKPKTQDGEESLLWPYISFREYADVIQVQIVSVSLAKQCVKVALMIVYVFLRSQLRF